MYLDGAGTPFLAGHAASAVAAPALSWFLAEGATGTLLRRVHPARQPVGHAGPGPDRLPAARRHGDPARLRARAREPPHHLGRRRAPLAGRHRGVGAPPQPERRRRSSPSGRCGGPTAAGTRRTTRPARPRPAPAGWSSAGEVGGPQHYVTYVLLANTSPFAGQARVTVLLEGGGTLERTFALAAQQPLQRRRRHALPRNRRTAASATLVESLGTDPAELVVEWSIYGTPGARPWELGANALAMNLSPPLHTLADRAIVRGGGATTIETFRAIAGARRPTFSVTSSSPGRRHRDHRRGHRRAARSRPAAAPGRRRSRSPPASPASRTSSSASSSPSIPGRAVTFGRPDDPRLAAVPGLRRHERRRPPRAGRHAATTAARWSRRTCARIGLGPIVDLFPPETTARTTRSTSTATGASIW